MEGELSCSHVLAACLLTWSASACSDSSPAKGSATDTISASPTVEVSKDEYAQAAADAVKCIEQRGFKAFATDQADGSIAISVIDHAGGEEAYDACTRDYQELGIAYLAQIRPSPEEAFQIMLQCLIDSGYLPAGAGPEDVDQVVDANGNDGTVADCINKPYLPTAVP